MCFDEIFWFYEILENDMVIKPTKAKKRIRILDDDSDDESDKEADAPNEEWVVHERLFSDGYRVDPP